MGAPTTFLGREYATPFWAASGTYGWGVEAIDGGFFAIAGDAAATGRSALGAVVTKGVSPQEMLGAPQPRVSEVGHGTAILNAIGLQNPGLEGFLSKYAERYDRLDLPCPIWVNVFAGSTAGYLEVINGIRAHVLKKRTTWLAGFELNVSCPNVDKGGAEFGADPRTLESLVKDCVKACGQYPLMVKLSPHAADSVSLAKACEEAGAAALAISNTMPAGMPGLETEAWTLGRRFGGMSGPALKPIALRLVDLVAKNVQIPICGIGGIQNARDVREFMSAGAQVVQIGTAHFANPWVAHEILQELER